MVAIENGKTMYEIVTTWLSGAAVLLAAYVLARNDDREDDEPGKQLDLDEIDLEQVREEGDDDLADYLEEMTENGGKTDQ